VTRFNRLLELVLLRRARHWLLGPRPALLIGLAALVLALLAAFTYVVLDSQAQSRREAEKRFGAEARISAELTAAIFTTSATSGQTAAAKAFGGPNINERALTSLARRSHFLYVLILGSDGRLLAASRGAPPAVRQRAQAPLPAHIRLALRGKASLSDLLPAPTGNGRLIEWALPFSTASGRRVEVEAFNAGLISGFLSGYLGGSRGDPSSLGYVLDSQGRLVGNSSEGGKTGEHLPAPSLLAVLARSSAGAYRDQGTQRYLTSASVPGSTWRVVLSEPTSRLYPALAGSRGWLLFTVLGAFAVAGAAGLLFLRRALQSGAQLASTNNELVALNASLEARVAERTAAAENHARELARSNVELEQFSSVASHDLQEPLRKIRMFGDRLRTGLGDDLPEERALDLARMQNAAERMQRLINDLLDFSRVTHRGREFQRVDLGTVTQEVLTDLEVRISELGAQVEVADLPVIEADATQMRQLLQNLIGNALKFHRDEEPPVVRISANVVSGRAPRFAGEAGAGDCCVITIEDNGIGFEEQYSERVFTAFERLHSRTAYEGTGIGLSIARKIAWRHGGNITAKSAPEQGATFIVTLPLTHTNGHDPSLQESSK
jgi:signal transduction histidine kinase